MLNKRVNPFNEYLKQDSHFIRIFFLTYPMYSLGIFFRHEEYLESNFWKVIFLSIFSQIFVTPILVLILRVRKVTLVKSEILSNYLNYFLISVIGVIIGISIIVFHSQLFGFDELWAKRLISGGLVFPLISYILVSVSLAFEKIFRQIPVLTVEVSDLETEFGTLKDRSALLSKEIQDRLTEKIVPGIREIRSDFNAISNSWSSAVTERMIKKVKDVSDRIIRKESHDFYESYSNSQKNLKKSFKNTLLIKYIREYLLLLKTPTFVILPATLIFIIVYVSRECYKPNFIIVSLLGFQLFVFKYVEKRLNFDIKYYGFLVNIALFFSVYLFFSGLIPVSGASCSNQLSINFKYFGASLIAIFTLSTSMYYLLIDNASIKIRSLVQRRDALKSQITEMEVLLNKNADEFVSIFHGEVQSGFSAVSMALQMMHNPDSNTLSQLGTSELIELMEDKLLSIEERVEELLQLRVNARLPFGVLVKEYISTWKGLLEIDLQISDLATETLLRSTQLNFFVLEILHELATNSVRHGGAHALLGTVDLVSPISQERRLIIEFQDDGQGLDMSKSNDFGLISGQIVRFGGQVEFKSGPNGGVLTSIFLPV